MSKVTVRPPVKEEQTHKPITANDRFKAQYNKYVRRSTGIALALILLFFLFSPRYVPHPYRLIERQFEIVDMPETVDLPPPPKDVPPPPKVVEAAPDDEVAEDVEIAETLMDFDDAFNLPTDGSGMDVDTDFEVSSEKPVLTKFVPPDYPEMARMSQLEGTVIVKVLVGPDGSVLDAQILQGIHPMLNQAALVAARKTRWEPGKQRNIPVKAWMALPYTFRLHS